MRIWTIKYKSKMISFATELLAYKHISKLLVEIVNDRNGYRYDHNDPIHRVLALIIKAEEYKLAYEFMQRYKSTSDIEITEHDLVGHVME